MCAVKVRRVKSRIPRCKALEPNKLETESAQCDVWCGGSFLTARSEFTAEQQQQQQPRCRRKVRFSLPRGCKTCLEDLNPVSPVFPFPHTQRRVLVNGFREQKRRVNISESVTETLRRG